MWESGGGRFPRGRRGEGCRKIFAASGGKKRKEERRKSCSSFSSLFVASSFLPPFFTPAAAILKADETGQGHRKNMEQFHIFPRNQL